MESFEGQDGWPDASDPIDPVSTYAHSVSRSCCCKGLWAYPSGRRNPIRAFLTYKQRENINHMTDNYNRMKSAAVAGMNGISQLNGVASAPGRSRTWLRALMR